MEPLLLLFAGGLFSRVSWRVFVRPVIADDGLHGAYTEHGAFLTADGERDGAQNHAFLPRTETTSIRAFAGPPQRADGLADVMSSLVFRTRSFCPITRAMTSRLRSASRQDKRGKGVAAMLVAVPAGASPAGGGCPDATVAIPGNMKGDRHVGSPDVNVSGARATRSDPINGAVAASMPWTTGRGQPPQEHGPPSLSSRSTELRSYCGWQSSITHYLTSPQFRADRRHQRRAADRAGATGVDRCRLRFGN